MHGDRIAADYVTRDIQAKDPDFDPETFERRIRGAFTKIQQQWCQQNLDPVMSWLSDGVAERWQVLLDEQKARGERDQIDDLHISAVKLVELQHEGALMP